MKNCGIEINDISIVVIDNNYQKQGDVEVDKLFKIESVYDDHVLQSNFSKRKYSGAKKCISCKRNSE